MLQELKVVLSPVPNGRHVECVITTTLVEKAPVEKTMQQSYLLDYDQLILRVQELVNARLQSMCNQVSFEARQLRQRGH